MAATETLVEDSSKALKARTGKPKKLPVKIINPTGGSKVKICNFIPSDRITDNMLNFNSLSYLLLYIT